jgi:hypothetical protein
MTSTIVQPGATRRPRIPFWLGACLFAAIATFLLWEEHQAHILGALPYLLLLACPLIHLFMHGGHGHGGRAQDAAGKSHEHQERAQGASP